MLSLSGTNDLYKHQTIQTKPETNDEELELRTQILEKAGFLVYQGFTAQYWCDYLCIDRMFPTHELSDVDYYFYNTYKVLLWNKLPGNKTLVPEKYHQYVNFYKI